MKKCKPTQNKFLVPGVSAMLTYGRFFKAIQEPINNLIMIHQEKLPWPLDIHQVPRIKRKDVREASTFGFRILNPKEAVTLRNSSVKLTFIRIEKGNLQ